VVDRTKVLFLGGVGRSGTTLLERVLGEVPGVCPLGEVVHLWERGLERDERCGCGEAFSACPFWQAVGHAAFGGWDAVDPHRLRALRARVDRARVVPRLARRLLPTSLQADVQEYAGYYARLYAAVAAHTGDELVVDSSKQVSLAFCLAHSPDVELVVARCVRDSRGVAYSWTKRVSRPEAGDEATHMPQYSPLTVSLIWNLHNAEFPLLPRLQVPLTTIRYEDFVHSPREVALGLLRFAGVDLPEEALGFVDDRGAWLQQPAHTVSGNPIRFRSGRLDFRHDDAWRRELPVAQQRLVTAVTAPSLHRYGYPLARRSAGAGR